MKKIFSLCVLAMILSMTALADIPRPKTPKPTPAPKEKKSIETGLIISLQKDAKEARLLIPKSQLKQLRAELEELDGEADSSATAGLTFSRTQTIVSGLFLSLALVFGGVWLARSRKGDLKPNKALVAGAVVFLGGALATAVYANIGPPLSARSITGKIFTPGVHMYKQASGKVRLEASDAEYVELIVPDAPTETKEDLNKFPE